MYIEICEDILEDAIAKSGLNANDSLDLLQLFALFSLKGNHVVSVPCLRSNKKLVHDLGKVMNPSDVAKLRRSDAQFYMLQSVKPTLSVYCLITYSETAIPDKRAIIINPAKMMKFEPYLRTKLITENLMDADFFNYVAHYYVRCMHYNGMRIRFEATPGGGSTTCDVVKREIVEGRRFCLVIVDSDKKCPKQKKYGDTAQKIVDVKTNYPSDWSTVYVMKEVMEVENLIPKRIVKQYASDKTDCDVLERDFSYYDMKVGLTLKGLLNDDIFTYQTSVFPELDYSQRQEAKNKTSCREEYERYIDEKNLENVLKRGFGSDLLKNVTCSSGIDGIVRYPELKDEMMNRIMPTDLTNKQSAEWENIGKLLFSWTCGLPAKSY